MVLQETWLKSGTVAENIAYGREGTSREEIIAAAKAAHAHSFIKRMPEGYDTMIQEEGGNLSQGQKQLLCIARVMLNLPPMLILDEATANLDMNSEEKMLENIKNYLPNCTVIFITHRFTLYKNSKLFQKVLYL